MSSKKPFFGRLSTSLLAALCVFSAFGGCSDDVNPVPTPDEEEEVYEPVEVESNGESLSAYKIVVADDAGESTQYAAEILQTRIKQATNTELPIATDSTSAGTHEIIVGKTNRNECSEINYEELGKESYVVKTAGKKLVIAGNDRGVLYGAYAYLEALGYRFYTTDTENIPVAAEVFVPEELNLTWTPTFEYREVMYYTTWDADWAVAQRINSDFQRDGDGNGLKSNAKYGGYEGYIGGGKWLVHTLQYLLPKDQYFSAHPEYFAEVDGARNPIQPCFSSEGAYEVVLEKALSAIKAEPNGTVLSISENDSGEYCTCSECLAKYEADGSVSDTFFRWLNRLAGEIGKVYPDVKIDTLSYAITKETPKNTDIADNVVVRLCPNTCQLHTSPDECSRVAQDWTRIEEWKAIHDNVYCWFYPIKWANIYAALPSYEANYAYVRHFAETGIKGVYAEGYPKVCPEFCELKAYLMAKTIANPMMSKSEYYYHYHDFIEGYYGDASEYIEEYISLTTTMVFEKLAQQEPDDHLDKWFPTDENFDFKWDNKTKTYDMTNIDKINELWADAVDCVGGKTLDHVKKSRIHWWYIELYSTMDNRYKYGDEEEKAALAAQNEELYNDIKYYGAIRKYDNSYLLANIDDFTVSPKTGRWLR